MKSKIACEFTIEGGKSGWRYLWTFTFWTCQNLDWQVAQWGEYSRALVRRKWAFVRVFEFHKQWGLHIHCVTDERREVEEALALGFQYGIGRINVLRVPTKSALYVAKYLTKQRDDPRRKKGMRMWAVCGKYPHRVKVSEIVVQSLKARCYRRAFASEAAKGMQFGQRAFLAQQHYVDVVLGRTTLNEMLSVEFPANRVFCLDTETGIPVNTVMLTNNLNEREEENGQSE